MQQLAAGFRVARMDFNWGAIEKTKGQYDFSAYDGLLQSQQPYNVTPYWILDYSELRCKRHPHLLSARLPRGPWAGNVSAGLQGRCRCDARGSRPPVTAGNVLHGQLFRPAPALFPANALYLPDGRSPDTPEADEAFAKFVVASMDHYKGKGIIWELYNE